MSFTRLDATDFVISADSVTAPAWSNNAPTLINFYTSSGVAEGDISSSYYFDIYNGDPSSANSSVQFSVAYGHIAGSGSAPINSLVAGNTPTRIDFGQFRNLIYGDAETSVNFGAGNSAAVDLIAIQVDRNRYKESLFPGTFNLRLSGSVYLNLTDNSNQVTTINYVDGGRAFDIISGSNGVATTSTAPTGAPAKGYTASGSYGLYLPDIGLILLNPAALSLSAANGGVGLALSSGVTTATSFSNNKLVYNLINNGANFTLNSQETISSNYVFVRVKSQEYNYTTNPSIFTSSSNGEFIYSNFINSPQTFPTTVGMFNDNNELLAVAKLSKPLTKDFTKEALIRVKLDW